jgi:hypothetical protein
MFGFWPSANQVIGSDSSPQVRVDFLEDLNVSWELAMFGLRPGAGEACDSVTGSSPDAEALPQE